MLITPRSARVLRRVATNHRWLRLSLVIGMLGLLLSNRLPILFLAAVAMLVINGMIAGRLNRYGLLKKFLLLLVLLTPILNLLVAGWLSRRHTHRLREAGINVGLFGARPEDIVADTTLGAAAKDWSRD